MFIVENHHEVLAAWAQYRSGLKAPPRLITLDHHTDTSAPFRNYLQKNQNISKSEELRTQWLNEIDFKSPNSVQAAIQKLSNDEHIVAAIQAGIISSAFVIAHNARDTEIEVYHQHKIMCYSVSRVPRAQNATREECDTVLESAFLNSALYAFDSLLTTISESPLLSQNYIFDVDLDYFNTEKSLTPKDDSTFQRLLKNAGLITIATEPAYVASCWLDSQNSTLR